MGPTDLDQQLQQARRSNFNPPSFGDRIRGLLHRNLIGATIRDNYALIPDFNSYGPKLDWSKFAPFISGVILRGSYGAIGFGGAVDTTIVQNCTDAALNNKPAVIYHAIDPGYYVDQLQSLTKMQNIDQFLPPEKDQQWQTFLKAIQYKKYYGLACDFELYKDWGGKTIGDAWLTEIAVQWMIRLLHFYPTMPRLFYSGEWFIKSYAPSLEVTARLQNTGCDAWPGFYPYSTSIVNLTDWWGQLKANYPPDTFMVNGRQSSNPAAFNFPSWKVWQFSGDKFTLPGVLGANGQPSGVDLNFYNGPQDAWNKYVGFNQVTPPAPPVPPTPDPTTGQFTADEVTKIKKVIGLFNFTDWESVLK